MHNGVSSVDVQPDDHFQFYGFSRYARELNELTPELKAVLPPTDTRFRPDQRSITRFYSYTVKNQFVLCRPVGLIPDCLHHQTPGGGEGSRGR